MTFLHILLSNWKTVAIVLVGVTLLTLGVYIKLLKSDITVLEADNKQLTESLTLATTAIDKFKKEQVNNLADLNKRENELKELVKENNEIKEHLERVYEDDKEACNWGSEPVPDAVLKLLCQG
jgi:Ran GTPase-activating protein (RanGAP) involved in mRNA processing and transport